MSSTQETCSSKGREMGVCQLSLFTEISGSLTADRGRASSMLSLEGSPAKTSAQQVRVKDLPETVRAYGLRCSELLRRSGLDMCSRKTVRTCVPVALAPSSKALPAWGMTHDGACWELGTRVRPTKETECGSMLPTPTCNPYGSDRGGRQGRVGKWRPKLGTLIERNMWPTPQSSDCRDRGHMGTKVVQRRIANGRQVNLGMVVSNTSGKLNPDWVEWLMGWPIGWTDLEPLATDRCHNAQRWRGASCTGRTMSDVRHGDALKLLQAMGDESVQACITSPPYWKQRRYSSDDELGQESDAEAYVAGLCDVLMEVHRVLKDNGTLWLNLGDTYAKTGQLSGIPWRVALELQRRGWLLRQDIIWHKSNPMPESVLNRCTRAHEYVFILAKQRRYLFDVEAIKVPSTGRKVSQRTVKSGKGFEIRSGLDKLDGEIRQMRRRHSVWRVSASRDAAAGDLHVAPYPERLVAPCVLAATQEGDTVLDPFCGSGTTGAVAVRLGREFVGIDLDEQACEHARQRIDGAAND